MSWIASAVVAAPSSGNAYSNNDWPRLLNEFYQSGGNRDGGPGMSRMVNDPVYGQLTPDTSGGNPGLFANDPNKPGYENVYTANGVQSVNTQGNWLSNLMDKIPMIAGTILTGGALAGVGGAADAGVAAADAGSVTDAAAMGYGTADASIGSGVGLGGAGGSAGAAGDFAGGVGAGGTGTSGFIGSAGDLGAGGVPSAGVGSVGASGGVGGTSSGAGGFLGTGIPTGQAIGIGGSLLSGVLGAGASRGAANTQADAANNATAYQQGIYNQTAQNIAPWLTAGKNTLGTLMNGMASGQFTQTPYGPDKTPPGLIAPAEKLGSAPSAGSMQMYQNAGAMQNLDPAKALQAYQQYTSQNPYQSMGPWTADRFQSDPGYQFQLQQGNNALTNAASLSGGMNSNNLRGLIGYNQQMANTDYQKAFGNFQTEAGRSLGEYQTGLQDYIQQFLTGQNTNTLNNQVTQQDFQNKATQAGFNNDVTQKQFQDAYQVTTGDNSVTQQQFLDAMATAQMDNSVKNQNFQNTAEGQAFNNKVLDDQAAQELQRQQLNNQGTQQNFNNLAALSNMGLGAGLQQGNLGANLGQSVANNMMGAGNAQAAGQIGTANAIGSGLGGAYNAWLQNQYMNNSGNGFLNNNAGILNQGLTPNDLYGSF